VYAIRHIQKGEEISISYLSELCQDAFMRRDILQQSHFFSCDCDRCRHEVVSNESKISLQMELENTHGSEIFVNMKDISVNYGLKGSFSLFQSYVDIALGYLQSSNFPSKRNPKTIIILYDFYEFAISLLNSIKSSKREDIESSRLLIKCCYIISQYWWAIGCDKMMQKVPFIYLAAVTAIKMLSNPSKSEDIFDQESLRMIESMLASVVSMSDFYLNKEIDDVNGAFYKYLSQAKIFMKQLKWYMSK
jgi:hypothetical protein